MGRHISLVCECTGGSFKACGEDGLGPMSLISHDLSEPIIHVGERVSLSGITFDRSDRALQRPHRVGFPALTAAQPDNIGCGSYIKCAQRKTL